MYKLSWFKHPALPALLVLILLTFSGGLWANEFDKQNVQQVKVVTTFSILADMVKVVGGESVRVSTLVDWDEDAHVYRPSPQDVKHLSKADILLMNGLGFEGWLSRLIAAADFQGVTVNAAEGVRYISTTLEKIEHDSHAHREHERHESHQTQIKGRIMEGRVDPHAWHSLLAAKIYIANILKALIEKDPEQGALFESNAKAFISELDSLFQVYEQKFASLPASHRQIVVPHNAFAYLARDFDLGIGSLQGLSTGGEASASQIARIVRQVRSLGVRAIFEENVADNRLIKVVQMETDVNFGGELISGALSHDLAPTYLDMMRYNLSKIYQALK